MMILLCSLVPLESSISFGQGTGELIQRFIGFNIQLTVMILLKILLAVATTLLTTTLAAHYHRSTHNVKHYDDQEELGVAILTPAQLGDRLSNKRIAANIDEGGYKAQRNCTIRVGFLPWCFVYDEHTGELTSIITTNYDWTEEDLRWDPDEYIGIESVPLSHNDFWAPRLECRNSLDLTTSKFGVFVEYNADYRGHCVMNSKQKFVTPCNHGHCIVILGLGGYYEGQTLELQDASQPVDMSSYYAECPWTVTTSQANIITDGETRSSLVELEFDIERAD